VRLLRRWLAACAARKQSGLRALRAEAQAIAGAWAQAAGGAPVNTLTPR